MHEDSFRERAVEALERIAEALEAMNAAQTLDDSGGTIPPAPTPGAGSG